MQDGHVATQTQIEVAQMNSNSPNLDKEYVALTPILEHQNHQLPVEPNDDHPHLRNNRAVSPSGPAGQWSVQNSGQFRCWRCNYPTSQFNFMHILKCAENSRNIQIKMICSRPRCPAGALCNSMSELHFFEELH